MARHTGSAVLPPDRPGSPGSLIVSFAGSYLREIGGWIAVADLISCLQAVDLTAPSVRQALVRLKSRGFLMADRRSGEAGYRLTEAGVDDLRSGDRRIFRPPAATVQDGWVLAVFSVPEVDRALRHQLRTELSWLGFGTVSPGVWIAPRPLAEPARTLLMAANLDSYVTWFGAANLGEIDVAAWWDLQQLRTHYDAFLLDQRPNVGPHRSSSPSPSAGAGDRAGPADDAAAFAADLRLIDGWRLFPRLDPGLPEALLPPDWPARAAWELFRDRHERWSAAGRRHVRAITGS